MKDQSNNPYFNTKIQKILNKLISEEWYAGNTYKLFVLSVKDECREDIQEFMMETSNDEIGDHMSSLVNWALEFGYEIPSTVKEFEKYASKKSVDGFNKIKKGQDAKYYIDTAIDLELDAINSYQEALEYDEDIVDFGSFLALIQRNLVDEQEHMENLQIMQYTNSISVKLED